MDPPVFWPRTKERIMEDRRRFSQAHENLRGGSVKITGFLLINGYSAGYSSIAYENNLSPLVEKFGGEIEKGELAIEESETGRLLPAGIFFSMEVVFNLSQLQQIEQFTQNVHTPSNFIRRQSYYRRLQTGGRTFAG